MYRELLEKNPFPVFSFTKKGVVLEANESAKELLNLWNEDLVTLSEKNLRVLIFKNTLGLQNVEILAGNSYFTFEVITLEDENLAFYGADVTYQKNNAETLFSMIDDIYEGMILIDTENDGQIVEVNYTISKVLGFPREELLGMRLKDIAPAFDSYKEECWKDHVKNIKSQKKGDIKSLELKSGRGDILQAEFVNSIRNVMEKDYQLALIRFKK